MAHEARTEIGPFTILPEWLLDLPLSDRAIRLYGVLGLYADRRTGHAFPARKTLAARLRCSLNTLDRARDELVEAGALRVEPRHRDNGSLTSCLYTVVQVCPSPTRGERVPPPTGPPEPEPIEPEPTDEPEGSSPLPGIETSPTRERAATAEKEARPRARRTTATADQVARTFWDHADPKPMVKFVALRQIIDTALKAGWKPDEVMAALRDPECDTIVGWKLESILRRLRTGNATTADRFWEK